MFWGLGGVRQDEYGQPALGEIDAGSLHVSHQK
jgi:hypothetical protein